MTHTSTLSMRTKLTDSWLRHGRRQVLLRRLPPRLVLRPRLPEGRLAGAQGGVQGGAAGRGAAGGVAGGGGGGAAGGGQGRRSFRLAAVETTGAAAAAATFAATSATAAAGPAAGERRHRRRRLQRGRRRRRGLALGLFRVRQAACVVRPSATASVRPSVSLPVAFVCASVVLIRSACSLARLAGTRARAQTPLKFVHPTVRPSVRLPVRPSFTAFHVWQVRERELKLVLLVVVRG